MQCFRSLAFLTSKSSFGSVIALRPMPGAPKKALP
jgi:hypothetical protein